MRLVDKARRLQDMTLALLAWRRLVRHDAWSRQDVVRHQQTRLDALVRHALARSPFYRKHYRGIDTGGAIALGLLPPLDKRTMMAEFDALVTDRRLRLSALEAHLAGLGHDALYLGRYRVLTSSGTGGLRGVFVFNRAEWRIELANALRWHDLMGVRPRLFSRLRISAIGAGSPAHVSARLTESSDVGLVRFQRLPVTLPVETLGRALERFRPEVLLAYPSVAALLALEALAGRLHIRPRVVATHSELLTAGMAQRIERAWGVSPFNHYGLTELSTFAAECAQGRGLHMLDDLFIAEIVDEDYRPVAPGTPGRRLLLTNLYNFTQPLIRYEVSDMLTLDPRPCGCGRPFPLIAAIAGRSEEMIRLAADGRTVTVSPLAITGMIEALPGIAECQVAYREGTLVVRLVPAAPAEIETVERAIRTRLGGWLSEIGAAATPLSIERCTALARPDARMGKVRLVET